ncbi:RagB/SusD family nutrient uptake outer membrane protein [Pedobacter rhizosphaerae]|uniref:SusD family protein n=1 Tax=Pedobacter rhizosphaerae TaxID=390241 RepID=A0A1H9N347_9SPHI|nr:RagB/SusD family nutrient uptake outer membrane protein [Pedobacter rhizosphaerae]SER30241.1 SusD family protein [Pedobacter rhizosphaerae]
MKKIFDFFVVLVFGLVVFSGCKKGYLDEKPSKSLTVPVSAADLQALLDNLDVMNPAPGLQQLATDDFLLTDAALASLTSPDERNAYSWKKEVFSSQSNSEWRNGWQQVFYANIVLDAISAKTDGEKAGLNTIKGAALFFRAMAYYHLSQMFTRPFVPASAGTDLGLPIRASSDVNLNPARSSLAETFAFMRSDLDLAVELLPERSDYKSRPNKAAALALLARISLVMQDYERAYGYADRSLKLYGTLINYNTLNSAAARPFPAVLPRGNDEVLFYAAQTSYSFMSFMSTTVTVNPELYNLYGANDLRRTVFFNATGRNFKGNYNNVSRLFGGMATDEVYLIRAECQIRLGKVQQGLDDLNVLLLNRYRTGTFVPYTTSSVSDPVRLILDERRRELPFRGQRMNDLRRINQESNYKVNLSRRVGGVLYELPAGDARYVYPIPQEEVTRSGMEQN